MNQEQFNRLSRAEQKALISKVFGEGTPERQWNLRQKVVATQTPDDYEPADRITLTLQGPPRSKKNHTTLGIIQSPAYRKYNTDAKEQLLPIRKLKDIDYNLNAHFYVDSYGKPADLIGLLQALADTLQDAGIVTNDRQFRAFDGSRKHHEYEGQPRTEIAITPLGTP